MSRTKLILILTFALAIGAGAVADRVAARWAGAPAVPPPPAERPSFLKDELNLTPDQQAKMRDVWSETMKAVGEGHADRRRALQAERDEAIQQLLGDEQKARFKKINDDFGQKMADVGRERDTAFASAVERTKLILSEPQQKKYEEILARRREGEHRHWDGHGPPRGGSATGPSPWPRPGDGREFPGGRRPPGPRDPAPPGKP